jgi:hypothetical protein
MQNENIHELLANLRSVKAGGDNSWTAYCPVHEGDGGTHNNSLSVSLVDDGRILVNCHNGCDPKEIVYAAGLTWAKMFPPKKKREFESKITATYDYEDEDRAVRFQVVRLEPGRGGAKKDFRQRQPDGKGGWTWKTKGLQKFPYRLPELRTSKGPVFIVEGEKQVDYLREKHGLTATTNPGGAGKWLKSFAKHFKNRDVIVIPDCDPPNEKTGLIVGADHAKTVADSLLDVAQSIHVIELPDCQPKWGLDDWLQNGHSMEDLQKLLADAKPWGPDSDLQTRVDQPEPDPDADPLEYEKKMLAEIGITYVAQLEDTARVEFFSATSQKFTTLEPSRMRYEELLMATGKIAAHKVRQTAEDNGDFSLGEIKKALALVAGATPSVEEKFGLGCWMNHDSMVFVNAKQLGILNGKPGLQVTQDPIYLGKAYDIGGQVDWVDFQQLKADLESADQKPGVLYHKAIEECRDFIAQWDFTYGASTFPSVLTGMIMATWLQTLWNWRPQIFLIGQSYAGKSTLLKQIAKILGPLAHISSDSSAAGLRQDIGTSAAIMLCDELEKSRHRNDILEMIRASGRGDEVFRGTSGQKRKRFKLQHVFWCASIESGLKSEADQSRFITAEIKKTPRIPEIPDIAHMTAMGRRMFSAAVCSFHAARALSGVLLENKVEGVHGRVCESYAIPCAMYSATMGHSEDEAVELFQEALRAIADGEDVETDAEALLQEILLTSVLLKGGEKQQVYRMIKDRYCSSEFDDALRGVGILVDKGRVFFNRNLLERYVVSQDWRGKRLDQILLRIPGAERTQKGFGKNRVLRGVSIPMDYIGEVETTPDVAYVKDDPPVIAGGLLPFEARAMADDPFRTA